MRKLILWSLLIIAGSAASGTVLVYNHTMNSPQVYDGHMPPESAPFTAIFNGRGDTTGKLYFEVSSIFQPDGNYMVELDRVTGRVVMTREFESFGMKFERHTDELMSFYEYPKRVWNAQDKHRLHGGIRFHTGGVMQIMDNQYRVVHTIRDGINVDSHDLVFDDGDWIYFQMDIRPLERRPTITCLLNCGLIGQSLVRVTPDGDKQVFWSALDYYEQDDFLMDDVFELNHQILYDVIHANSVDLTPDGNYIVSLRHPNEVMVLDRNGELLWRSRDYTFTNDDGFFHQHDAQILDNGNLILFDNGNGHRTHSRAVEYAVNHTARTLTRVWEWSTPEAHFSPTRGSVQRLSNGNTLMNFVDHGIYQIDADGNIIMRIDMPDGYASYQARIAE